MTFSGYRRSNSVSPRTRVGSPPDAVCRGLPENQITLPAGREGERRGCCDLAPEQGPAWCPHSRGDGWPWPFAGMLRASPAREGQARSRRQDLSWNHFGGSVTCIPVRCPCPSPSPASPGTGWETRTPTRFVIPRDGLKTQQVPFPSMSVAAGLKIGVLSCFPACCPLRKIMRYVHISHLISASMLSNDYEFA